MEPNKMLGYSMDLKSDITYAVSKKEELIVTQKDKDTLEWLIEQAQRAEMYKSALGYISNNKMPFQSSNYANMALFEADQRFIHFKNR